MHRNSIYILPILLLAGVAHAGAPAPVVPATCEAVPPDSNQYKLALGFAYARAPTVRGREEAMAAARADARKALHDELCVAMPTDCERYAGYVTEWQTPGVYDEKTRRACATAVVELRLLNPDRQASADARALVARDQVAARTERDQTAAAAAREVEETRVAQEAAAKAELAGKEAPAVAKETKQRFSPNFDVESDSVRWLEFLELMSQTTPEDRATTFANVCFRHGLASEARSFSMNHRENTDGHLFGVVDATRYQILTDSMAGFVCVGVEGKIRYPAYMEVLWDDESQVVSVFRQREDGGGSWEYQYSQDGSGVVTPVVKALSGYPVNALAFYRKSGVADQIMLWPDGLLLNYLCAGDCIGADRPTKERRWNSQDHGTVEGFFNGLLSAKELGEISKHQREYETAVENERIRIEKEAIDRIAARVKRSTKAGSAAAASAALEAISAVCSNVDLHASQPNSDGWFEVSGVADCTEYVASIGKRLVVRKRVSMSIAPEADGVWHVDGTVQIKD